MKKFAKAKLNKIPPGYSNINGLEKLLKDKPERYWIDRGEKRVLQLFHLMSERVPAYKDFLKKNKINPILVKNMQDFKKIPTIDKNNYLRNYPLDRLCWDGQLSSSRFTISTNSGSTGEPYYFPRDICQDYQYAILAELYLRNNFDIQKKTTLYLDCFAMGAWIGGVFTYEAIRLVAENGKYPLTIYTPGIYKDEILKAIQKLSSNYDQTIIGGYPPFVKDILDEGCCLGIDWKKYNLKFVFSAEGFAEEFRDYIYRKSGVVDYCRSSLNHYGTADMGTMAYETPISILIRKMINKNLKHTKLLFPESSRLPTLTQYFPDMYFFEQIKDTLCCSGYSGLPLVRYDLKDYGGVLNYNDIAQRLLCAGCDLNKESNDLKTSVWKLPFVYLYERKDFVVKLYGANIFPESIRHALQQRKFENVLTSKFTLMIKYDNNQNQYLEVNIELKKDVVKSESLSNQIQSEIVKYLLKENSEYESNYKSMEKQQTPMINLWSYEYPDFFNSGCKQRWVRKDSLIK